MTLITLEELARSLCVAIGGGIAGQLVVAMPGSAIWLLPAGAAVAGCALTVPEIRAEVASTLPMLAAAGQRVRHALPGGQRRALPTSQAEDAPSTSSSAATHPANAAVPPSTSAAKGEQLIPTLESTPHRLIIGHTRGGKTTLMHHMATSWAQQGERVLVADPDAAPGLWPGCTVTGHGDDLESITRMLEEVKVEVAARRKARAQGTRQFPPLHLVIDEAQDVLPAIEGGLELFEDIARRGGKLNIRMTVGVQDKQVRTLGLQGKSEVLRNLQVADVLKNREGQRVAMIRDAETGQKISLAVPDLPNPERLIKPVEPLRGELKPGLMDYPRRDSGSCVNDALAQLIGRDPGLRSWIDGVEIPELAAQFGLRFINGTQLTMEDIVTPGPCAVCFTTGDGVGHVEYTTNPLALLQAMGNPGLLGMFRPGATSPTSKVAPDPDPLLAALLNTSVPSAAGRPETENPVSVSNPHVQRNENSHTQTRVTVTPERNGGGAVVKIFAQAMAGRSRGGPVRGRGLNMRQRRIRIAREQKAEVLRQAYAEARASGIPSFRKAYADLGGNRAEALAAWQAAAPPTKAASAKA
ncbi:MAG: hypothetical protein EI684_05315 [Candidatus Viridilinea halotolerans]|uniref:Uncharacterized protein n=1 Tax=Candidatus Viridilinea halotolerans TaxID=2491704 RepID=A0A426U5P0_9CHLR|nr:MAG: hypothetical protein EI684_05315 [Candidatus Viridilinea halotolerans]